MNSNRWMDPAPLLRFLEQAVGGPYVYGGTGRPCTPAYRRERMAQYPAQASAIRANCPQLSGRHSCDCCKHRHRPCYDCAQLTRAALGTLGLKMPSGASSQWKAREVWAWQGPISALAHSHVCLLFRRDSLKNPAYPMAHVGVSLGQGFAVDARNHRLGVVRSKITAYPWTHMAFPRGLALPGGLGDSVLALDSPPAPRQKRASLPLPPLRHGMQGEPVQALQRRLLQLGYRLPIYGADGKYGLETAAALRAFQHVTGLPPTGQADQATLDRLIPKPPPPSDPWAMFEEEPEGDPDLFD